VENEGVSNAGLYDQMAESQLVNKYIPLFGGNPSDVSAWGESTEAGSLYWLLTQQGGTHDPLFRPAVIQSQAFADNIDRYWLMEENFQAFATAAGCGGQGLACLRAANTSTLNAAGANFAWSPGPDGKYFRQDPTPEIAQGTLYPNLFYV
jgi:carboxylesterase type B